MKILFKFSKKGESLVNEDVCDCFDNCAWVIDGATDVFKKGYLKHRNEVNWYVNLLNDKIKEIIYKQADGTIFSIIKLAVCQIYSSLSEQYEIEGLPEFFFPTYAIAAIQHLEDEINYFVLGDCTILALHNDQISILEDQRINVYSQRNREIIKEFLENSEEKEIPTSLYEDTRRMANVAGGYPIGSVKGSSIENGKKGVLKMSEGDRVVIYSDGFKDYIKAFPNARKNFFDPALIKDEIERMYSYLKDEQIYINAPRPKHIDDCSIILLEV